MATVYGTSAPSYLNTANYQTVIQDMVAKGQSWVRLGIAEQIALNEGSCTPTSLVWNESNLVAFETARDYARSRGLRVYYFTALPLTFTSGYTQDQYESVVNLYMDYLSNRFTGKIDAWQITNEANTGDYRALARDTTSPAYMSELQRTLSVARAAIRRHDTTHPITAAVASSSTGGLDAVSYTKMTQHLDAIASYIDVVDVHVYDGAAGSVALAALPGYLQSLATRYVGKPIWVGEFGTYSYVSGQPTYTEQYQSDSLVAHVNAINNNAAVAFVYQWQDEWPTVATTPGSYSTAPTGITFTGGGGSGMTGTVQTAFVGGVWTVTGVTITNPGHNYTSAPTGAFTGGAGASPAATATVTLNSQQLGLTYPDSTAKIAYTNYLLAQPAAPYLAYATIPTLEGSGHVPGGYSWDVLEKARYEQTALAGTNFHNPVIQATALDAVPWWARNLVVNGGFEINARTGTTFDASIGDTAPADAWRATYGVWSREAVATDSSPTSLKVVPDGTHLAYIRQSLPDWQQYAGLTLSWRVRAFGAVIYTYLDFGVSQAFSAGIDCTAGWKTILMTATAPKNLSQLTAGISEVSATNTAAWYIDNVHLGVSNGAVGYQPLQPAMDRLRAKQRFFVIAVSHRFRATAIGQVEDLYLPFPFTMVALPTVSPTNGNGTNAFFPGTCVSTNVTSAVATDITTDGARIELTATAVGDAIWTNQFVIVDSGVY